MDFKELLSAKINKNFFTTNGLVLFALLVQVFQITMLFKIDNLKTFLTPFLWTLIYIISFLFIILIIIIIQFKPSRENLLNNDNEKLVQQNDKIGLSQKSKSPEQTEYESIKKTLFLNNTELYIKSAINNVEINFNSLTGDSFDRRQIDELKRKVIIELKSIEKNIINK